jgi:subtilisin family serine protease
MNYPAAYPKAIAVAAVNRANTHSNFSNVHPYVDVAAPGGSTIFGADPFQEMILSPIPIAFGPGCGGNPDCYDFDAGTSQAAAYVSGVAALLDSRGLTNVQIRRRIEATATDLGPAGRDNTYGHGLVNAQAAVGR